jgi:preprotein translocase subunit SecE
MAAQTKDTPSQKKPQVEKNVVQSGNRLLDVALWIVVAVLLGTAIAGNYLLNKFYGDFFASSNLYALLKGVGVVIVIILAVIVAMFSTSGKNVLTFAKESYVELRRVVWPTPSEARTTTIIVGVVTCIVALMLWVFDTIFVNIIHLLTSL